MTLTKQLFLFTITIALLSLTISETNQRLRTNFNAQNHRNQTKEELAKYKEHNIWKKTSFTIRHIDMDEKTRTTKLSGYYSKIDSFSNKFGILIKLDKEDAEKEEFNMQATAVNEHYVYGKTLSGDEEPELIYYIPFTDSLPIKDDKLLTKFKIQTAQKNNFVSFQLNTGWFDVLITFDVEESTKEKLKADLLQLKNLKQEILTSFQEHSVCNVAKSKSKFTPQTKKLNNNVYKVLVRLEDIKQVKVFKNKCYNEKSLNSKNNCLIVIYSIA